MEEFEIRVPKIHSLSKLFSLCPPVINIDLDGDIVIALDSLYLESRYPGEFGLLPGGKPSNEQVEKFYNFSLEVYLAVKKQLEKRS